MAEQVTSRRDNSFQDKIGQLRISQKTRQIKSGTADCNKSVQIRQVMTSQVVFTRDHSGQVKSDQGKSGKSRYRGK